MINVRDGWHGMFRCTIPVSKIQSYQIGLADLALW
jgi:hypothetical protein